MVVMKFGGTSVEDAAAMRNAIAIIRAELETAITKNTPAPMVVVSACSGITNKLIALCDLATSNKGEDAFHALVAIKEHHLKIIAELLKEKRPKERATQFVETHGNDLANLITAADVIGEKTPRLVDAFASHGELLSSYLLGEAMNEQGIKTEWKDARSVLITTDDFGKAQPLWDISERRAQRDILPLLEQKTVVLSQGYIGATESGKTITLGRGGSDYSASIFGALLGATAIQIWTDVDGVLTSDPRIVTNARRLKVMTFSEAAELAYFGAKVLHPSTIYPAVTKNIPVLVLNSKRPHVEGTLITKEIEHTDSTAGLVKSIAHKKGQIVVNITSTKMLGAFGFLADITQIFAKYETPIDMISTSEVSVSLTIGDRTHLSRIVADLKKIAEVDIEENVAIVCVVGDSIRTSAGVAARIFQAVSTINMKMISQGASEINIGFVVDEKDAERAVRLLHDEFFSEVQSGEIFA
jgi:aspartate kinase